MIHIDDYDKNVPPFFLFAKQSLEAHVALSL